MCVSKYKTGDWLLLSSDKVRDPVIKQATKNKKLIGLRPLIDEVLRKEGILSVSEIALVLSSRTMFRSRPEWTCILRPINARTSSALGGKI